MTKNTNHQKGFTKEQLRKFKRITKKYDKLKKPHYDAITEYLKQEWEEMRNI